MIYQAAPENQAPADRSRSFLQPAHLGGLSHASGLSGHAGGTSSAMMMGVPEVPEENETYEDQLDQVPGEDGVENKPP